MMKKWRGLKVNEMVVVMFAIVGFISITSSIVSVRAFDDGTGAGSTDTINRNNLTNGLASTNYVDAAITAATNSLVGADTNNFWTLTGTQTATGLKTYSNTVTFVSALNSSNLFNQYFGAGTNDWWGSLSISNTLRVGGNVTLGSPTSVTTNIGQANFGTNVTASLNVTIQSTANNAVGGATLHIKNFSGQTNFSMIVGGAGGNVPFFDMLTNGAIAIRLTPFSGIASYINSDGLGISTNIPQAKLHVNGSFRVEGFSTNVGNFTTLGNLDAKTNTASWTVAKTSPPLFTQVFTNTTVRLNIDAMVELVVSANNDVADVQLSSWNTAGTTSNLFEHSMFAVSAVSQVVTNRVMFHGFIQPGFIYGWTNMSKGTAKASIYTNGFYAETVQ